MPFICTQDPRAEQSWWKGQVRLAWHSPEPAELVLRLVLGEPAQHLSSASRAALCHESPHRILLLLRTVLSSALLFSPWHLHSWNILQIWFWFGTGIEVRVQMDQFAGVILALWKLCAFLASVHWVTRSACKPLPWTESAQILRGCLTKNVWGWMWSVLKDLEVERSVTMMWRLQFGSHSHWACLCVCVKQCGMNHFRKTVPDGRLFIQVQGMAGGRMCHLFLLSKSAEVH